MEPQLTRKQAFWILNGLPAIGPISLNRLLAHFDGDPRVALGASRRDLQSVEGISKKAVDVLAEWGQHFDLEKEESGARQRGVDFVSCEDPDYPELLREIPDPPIGLYRLGKYDFKKPGVAIVGSRNCTLYGQSVARSFARDLAGMGFCVVSGMARGIDTLAHKGAMEAKDGSTVCVFGCGIDIVYPPENVDVFREAQAHGAVVSEFPFGRRADKQTFPMRNRVISGMSHAVIVVETDESGGSMITARFAGEQGRLICAVPGRIDQKSSRGCHQLIRDGAMLLTSLDELLEELAHLNLMPAFDLPEAREEAEQSELSASQRALVAALRGGEARFVEELSTACGLSSSEVASTLMMLEIDGVVAKRLDGRYELAVATRR